MTGRDLERGSERDHSIREPDHAERAGHGRHHWMMIACCIPMIIIVLALVAAGTISIGFVLFAVACVGMMVLMMRAMDHGSSHQ